MQYISSCKQKAGKLYPDIREFQSGEENERWMKAVRIDIEKGIIKKVLSNGQSIENKARGVGRRHMKIIAEAFLAANTIAAIEKRAAAVTSFCGVGRSGECTLTSFSTSYWDSINDAPTFDWNQNKTPSQSPMNFFPDADCWEMDWFHAMGCLAIVTGVGQGSS